MTTKTIVESDLMGAAASGLCAIHCLATPFLFLAQSCSNSGCCSSGPWWWSLIDYLFIGVTFLAVFYSAKNTSKAWMKYALYASWGILSLLVINGKLGFLPLPDYFKHLAALGMIVLHLYNRKYCQCQDQSCCTAAAPSTSAA